VKYEPPNFQELFHSEREKHIETQDELKSLYEMWRYRFAGMALQGFYACPDAGEAFKQLIMGADAKTEVEAMQMLSRLSVMQADFLLEELKKKPE
jgi:hypothetical protein